MNGLTLTHWGAYAATADVDGGVVLEGVPEDPDTSAIGDRLRHVDRLRVRHPAVRRSWILEGPLARPELRGREPFVQTSWDRALDLVARALATVRAERGNEAIFGGSYGWGSAGRFHHPQSQLKRFLNTIGGYTASIGTYSHGAAEVVAPAVLGLSLDELLRVAPAADEIADHAQLVLSLGGFPASNTQITSGGDVEHWYRPVLRAARDRGVRFVSAAPNRTSFDDEIDAEWLAIRPGTDAALLIGLMGEVVQRGLHDRRFLARHTSGHRALIDRLRGEDDGIVRDASWAAAVCDVDPGALRQLAVDLATTPHLVNACWSTQRVRHGEQVVWALIALAAVLGRLGRPGQGLAFGLGSMGSVGRPDSAARLPSLPQGTNPISAAIPVSRIADALERPGASYRYARQHRTFPHLDLLYWCGGNPFHHHQDLHRLEAVWRRPRGVVVNEPHWTATARRADVVLPTTLGSERHDLGGASTGTHLVSMEPVLSAPADARDDHDVFRGLARRLGTLDEFTEGRSPDEWIAELTERSSALVDQDGAAERLRRDGLLRRRPDRRPGPLAAHLAGPTTHPLRTPSGRIELTLALDGAPSSPDWHEPEEWIGAAGATDRLHLLSPMPIDRLHSQLGSADAAPEPVIIAPVDGSRLGIRDGDPVVVSNDRGECLGRAHLSDGVRPGVVVIRNGRRFDPDPLTPHRCRAGNPNVLTSDRPTSDWAQATAAHSCLVRVRRADT